MTHTAYANQYEHVHWTQAHTKLLTPEYAHLIISNQSEYVYLLHVIRSTIEARRSNEILNTLYERLLDLDDYLKNEINDQFNELSDLLQELAEIIPRH